MDESVKLPGLDRDSPRLSVREGGLKGFLERVSRWFESLEIGHLIPTQTNDILLNKQSVSLPSSAGVDTPEDVVGGFCHPLELRRRRQCVSARGQLVP